MLPLGFRRGPSAHCLRFSAIRILCGPYYGNDRKTLSSCSVHPALSSILSDDNFSVSALLVGSRLVYVLFFMFHHLLGCPLSPWGGVTPALDLRVSVFKQKPSSRPLCLGAHVPWSSPPSHTSYLHIPQLCVSWPLLDGAFSVPFLPLESYLSNF